MEKDPTPSPSPIPEDDPSFKMFKGNAEKESHASPNGFSPNELRSPVHQPTHLNEPSRDSLSDPLDSMASGMHVPSHFVSPSKRSSSSTLTTDLSKGHSHHPSNRSYGSGRSPVRTTFKRNPSVRPRSPSPATRTYPLRGSHRSNGHGSLFPERGHREERRVPAREKHRRPSPPPSLFQSSHYSGPRRGIPFESSRPRSRSPPSSRFHRRRGSRSRSRTRHSSPFKGGSSSFSSSSANCRVFVGNLAYDCTWQNLKDFGREAGHVVNATILESLGKSKGCGILEYRSETDARRAISNLNDQFLRGRRAFLREDRAEAPPRNSAGPFSSSSSSSYSSNSKQGLVRAPTGPPDPRRIFIHNLPFSVTSKDLVSLFRKVGDVVRGDILVHADSGRSKGSGIVMFSTEDDARRAIRKLDRYTLHDRKIEVREDRGSKLGGDRDLDYHRGSERHHSPPPFTSRSSRRRRSESVHSLRSPTRSPPFLQSSSSSSSSSSRHQETSSHFYYPYSPNHHGLRSDQDAPGYHQPASHLPPPPTSHLQSLPLTSSQIHQNPSSVPPMHALPVALPTLVIPNTPAVPATDLYFPATSPRTTPSGQPQLGHYFPPHHASPYPPNTPTAVPAPTFSNEVYSAPPPSLYYDPNQFNPAFYHQLPHTVLNTPSVSAKPYHGTVINTVPTMGFNHSSTFATNPLHHGNGVGPP